MVLFGYFLFFYLLIFLSYDLYIYYHLTYLYNTLIVYYNIDLLICKNSEYFGE